jgi:hypothetical protein
VFEPAEIGALTVRVVLKLFDPDAFVAVSVYVAVEEGLTETEVPVTDPMPGAMESEVAPVAFQESVADWPVVMLEGDAEKDEMVGRDTGVDVGVAVVTAAVE